MLFPVSQNKARILGRSRDAFTLIEVLIAFLIFGMVSAGMIYGYVQANRIAEWSSMSLGAQSYASQGVEQARAAKWDTEANGEVTAQQMPYPTNYTLIDTNDVPQSGAPLYLTNYMTIYYVPGYSVTNGTGPYLLQILSQVAWRFPLTGKMFTNTIVTFRAPDQ
jgi:prepilin-type N-terminal cleavage/methylation domain-containing protein